MLFYEKSSGTAVLYEMAANGGLGGQARQMKGLIKKFY
jgi:hypothetical protein